MCTIGYSSFPVLLHLFTFAILPETVFSWSTLLDITANDDVLMESPYGVPISFGYSETSDSPWSLNSVPGCPKAIDGYPWVYYGSRPKCYLVGRRGPCPAGSILRVRKGSTYGVCSDRGGTFPLSPKDRDKYYIQSNQVQDSSIPQSWYNLWQRGPCGQGQWLLWDKDKSSSTCVHQCSGGFSGPMWYDGDSWGGRCVPRWVPSYSPNDAVERPSIGVNPCPEGDKLKYKYSSTLKKCVPIWPEDYIFVG